MVVIDSESEGKDEAGAAPSSQGAQEDEPAPKKRKGKMVIEMGNREAKVRKLLVGIGKAREALDELAEALEILEGEAKELL